MINNEIFNIFLRLVLLGLLLDFASALYRGV